MKDESTVQQEIQIEAKFYNCTLMRNNNGAMKDETGRVVRYGLGHISKKQNDSIKSSDLIGITKITITKDMVGEEIGVFTAIECKKEGWIEDKKFDKREVAQSNFIEFVKSMGGIAGFASSIDNLKDLLRK